MTKDIVYIKNRRLLIEIQKGLPVTKTITLDQLEKLERSVKAIAETLADSIAEKKRGKQNPIDDEVWLNAERTGKILYIHPKTVGRYCREKRIIGKKLGKGWLIKKSDLDEFK